MKIIKNNIGFSDGKVLCDAWKILCEIWDKDYDKHNWKFNELETIFYMVSRYQGMIPADTEFFHYEIENEGEILEFNVCIPVHKILLNHNLYPATIKQTFKHEWKL